MVFLSEHQSTKIKEFIHYVKYSHLYGGLSENTMFVCSRIKINNIIPVVSHFSSWLIFQVAEWLIETDNIQPSSKTPPCSLNTISDTFCRWKGC